MRRAESVLANCAIFGRLDPGWLHRRARIQLFWFRAGTSWVATGVVRRSTVILYGFLRGIWFTSRLSNSYRKGVNLDRS